MTLRPFLTFGKTGHQLTPEGLKLEILAAIRELMNPPEPPRRPIGFVTVIEKKPVH